MTNGKKNVLISRAGQDIAVPLNHLYGADEEDERKGKIHFQGP